MGLSSQILFVAEIVSQERSVVKDIRFIIIVIIVIIIFGWS